MNLDKSVNTVKKYFLLIQNLSEDDKIRLIAEISNSIVNSKKNTEIFENKSNIEEKTADDFINLLNNSPKISLKEDNITREWIHKKEDENDLYR